MEEKIQGDIIAMRDLNWSYEVITFIVFCFVSLHLCFLSLQFNCEGIKPNQFNNKNGPENEINLLSSEFGVPIAVNTLSLCSEHPGWLTPPLG